MLKSAQTRIPFWSIVRQSYVLSFRGLITTLAQGWFWLVSALVANVALDLITWPTAQRVAAALSSSEPTMDQVSSVDVWIDTFSSFNGLLAFGFLVPVLVAWHRNIVSERSANLTRTEYSSFSYLVASAVLLAPLAMILLAFSGLEVLGEEAVYFGHAGIAVSFFLLVLIVVLPRISVKLVAVALGRADLGWGNVWRAGKGNTWRLFGADFLTRLPIILPLYLWSWESEPVEMATHAIFETVEFALGVITTLIGHAVISLAFVHFYGADEPTDQPN